MAAVKGFALAFESGDRKNAMLLVVNVFHVQTKGFQHPNKQQNNH